MNLSKMLAVLTIVDFLIPSQADGAERMRSLIWFGNSYSDAGRIWRNVPEMINSNSGVVEDLTIDSLMPKIQPSCWLDCHESTWPAFAVIDSGRYDYVVAQNGDAGWVKLGYSGGAASANQLTNWASHAKGAGGVLVIEQIWLPTTGVAYTDEDQDKSDFWYDSVARATNSILVPCGRAWWTARKENPNLEYIEPNWNDGRHPGTFSAYMNECCFFAALTGKSPVGLNFKKTTFASDVTLSDADALFAQQKAWEAYLYFNPTTNLTIANLTANPGIVVRNSAVSMTFSATVTCSNPISSVFLDLGALGGSARIAMVASGSTYSYTCALPQNASTGMKTISVQATDNSGTTVIGRARVNVELPLSLSAVKAIHYTTKVRAFFSEALDRTTAENIANYSIDQGVTVAQAVLEDDPHVVSLTTTALSVGVNYTLTVSNVKDDAGSIIPSNTTKGFTFTNPLRGAPYAYYEAASITAFTSLDQTSLKSTDIGTNFNLTPATAGTNFGLIYNGMISVPRFGAYTFFITADDQGEIYVDGARVVATNYSSGEQASGLLTLSAGFHAIKVQMFQNCCGVGLSVAWSGPSVTKGAIPDSCLYYDPAQPVQSTTRALDAPKSRTQITRLGSGDILIRAAAGSKRVAVYGLSGVSIRTREAGDDAVLVLPVKGMAPGAYIVKTFGAGKVDIQRIHMGF